MVGFKQLVGKLIGLSGGGGTAALVDAASGLDRLPRSEVEGIAELNAALLLELAGEGRRTGAEAAGRLAAPARKAPASMISYYERALELVRGEIEAATAREPAVRAGLEGAVEQTDYAADRMAATEAVWSLFFPEGVGILGREAERINELRERRTIRISELNPQPIADPVGEVLLTSNVLLTVPSPSTDIASLPYPKGLRRALELASGDRQLRWYDHPIQIGVEPEANELLYGLRGLDRAAAFERQRRRMSGRLRVALSVSVTHERLQDIAHAYVREELARAGGFDNLDVNVFTEADTRRLLDEVLLPLAAEAGEELREVFGVDGEYGRHYSFLKAIAALWAVLIDDRMRATFKIDLDQVFPQEVLVAETGRSAFEHLMSPLWGARGVDHWGDEVELGMLAGALVNERDIARGLFTPDVDFPAGPATPDEYVFFSRLPQALSTRAEMMERYDGRQRDGRRTCLERIHVTGGTNGILIDALRHHRPFTPSFFGRAEDQAYILSVLRGKGSAGAGRTPRLAYAHAAGLIMRHDKEVFAGQAIEAAHSGKLVGDDVRILYFSAYADLLGRERIKTLTDPFTGCFISRLPQTVVLLRFALRLAHAIERGDRRLARELAVMGTARIDQALDFTANGGGLAERVERERRGWHAYFDALDDVERRLHASDPRARRMRASARAIVEETLVSRH